MLKRQALHDRGISREVQVIPSFLLCLTGCVMHSRLADLVMLRGSL